jgi:hypothetical protein
MNGIGKLYYDSGRMAYSGGFWNNKVDGKGIMFNDNIVEPGVSNSNSDNNNARANKHDLPDYKNLDTVKDSWISFEGTFKADFKHGIGVFLLSNGDVFHGEFLND